MGSTFLILYEFQDHDSKARYVKLDESIYLQHWVNNFWIITKEYKLLGRK